MHKEYTDQIGDLHSRHCADIENKPPEPPQSGLCLLKGGGGLFSGGYGIRNIVQLVGIKFGCWIQIDIAN